MMNSNCSSPICESCIGMVTINPKNIQIDSCIISDSPNSLIVVTVVEFLMYFFYACSTCLFIFY